VTGSGSTALAEPAWWPPDLALAPEPVLPPDPCPDWLPVLRDEPADLWDHWAEPDITDGPDDLAGPDHLGVAREVAEVADGADADGEQIGLVAAVQLLSAVDPRVLDGAARVDLIRGWERVLAMAAGEQQVALAAVADATMGFGLTGMDARHEVGAALRLAPGTAAERTEVALALTGRLADTLAAVRRGEVSWRQAADLAVAVRDLPDDLAARVQARVLPRMGARTAAESRRAVQDAVVAVDPDGPAAEGGVLPGDQVTGLWPTRSDGSRIAPEVDTPYRFGLALYDPGAAVCNLDVRRGTEELSLHITPRLVPGGRVAIRVPDPGRQQSFFR